MDSKHPSTIIGTLPSICTCYSAACHFKSTIKWTSKKNLPHIRITFENLSVEALIDSGSMVPLLSEDIYTKVTKQVTFTSETIEAYGCNGSSLEIIGVATGNLSFHKNDTPIKAQFYVLRKSTQDCILPHTWLGKLRAVLDYNLSCLTYEIPPGNNILLVDGSLHQLNNNDTPSLTDNDIDSNPKPNLEKEKDTSLPQEEEEENNEKDTSTPLTGQSIKSKISIRPYECRTIVLPRHPKWPRLVSLPTTNGYGFVRNNSKDSKQLLTLFNDSDKPLVLNTSKPLPAKKKPAKRLIPVQISSWTVSSDTPSPETTQKLMNQHQSTFDHHTKTLENVPINSKKINFIVPTTIEAHPFDNKSDALTILYVYLIHLLGSNLQYMNKTEQELQRIATETGQKYQRRLLKKIQTLYNSAKIQYMYSQLSIYIVHQLHICFLKFQAKHTNQKKTLTPAGYQRQAILLHTTMVNEIKGIIALYFLNQKLINEFYEKTLKHPYFQQMELPFSLEETITEIQNTTTQTSTNAINIPTPVSITSKQSLQDLIQEPTEQYQPKLLNFQQYKEQLHKECNQYTSEYHEEMNKHNTHTPKIHNIAQVKQEDLQPFIQYNKSQSRLADFVKEQLPQSEQLYDARSVDELLNSIPTPKWICYENVEQVIDDYIPNCLLPTFQEFFIHFSDPVFIRFSSEFCLPYPPNATLTSSDPPDILHLNNGLIHPKTLAATSCQFLSYNHPLLKEEYKLELTKLACIMFIYGQFGLSLHALDTGLFKRQFEVKTLLAPTAPLSSFPAKQATENTSPDLDERISFLKKQGKIAEILGSPFQAQLSAVPKNYKTGKIIHSSKSDPILQYISSLPEKDKQQLANQSSEITEIHKNLIQSLEEVNEETPPGADEPKHCTIHSATHTQPKTPIQPKTTHYRPFLGTSIVEFQIYDIISRRLEFQSPTPPSLAIKRQLTADRRTLKRRYPKKVRFAKAHVLLVNDPEDLKEYRKRVKYSRYFREYFLTPDDYHKYQTKFYNQMIGTESKNLLAGSAFDPAVCNTTLENKTPIKYLSHHFSNIGQLARNKLKLSISDHQKHLANCNNIHFAIVQFSSQAPQNRLADEDDPNYQIMKKLASDPRYLVKTHNVNLTNRATDSFIKYCFSLSLPPRPKLSNQQNFFGNIKIPHQGTQNLSQFVSALVTSMRRLDHKRALRTGHSTKQNTLEILQTLDPQKKLIWNSITLKDICKIYPTWVSFLDKIAVHYQISALWIYVTVVQSKILHQHIQINKLQVSNPEMFDPKKPAFIIGVINTNSDEFYRIRPNIENITKYILQVQSGNANKVSDFPNVMNTLENKDTPTPETDHPPQKNTTDTENLEGKPRYTKTIYPHLQKTFYQKNAITRIILNSRDTNKLARPANNQVQSQSDIMQNLGSSELFSNYDLTAAYDALPACPISSLLNTARYRNKELSLLIASQGGSNSVLYCQRAVTSLMHRINDQMLLHPCYLPKSVANISPTKQQQFSIKEKNQQWDAITVSHSWSGQPMLHLPGPQIIKDVQTSLMYHTRQSTKIHNLPMSYEQRQHMFNKHTSDQILSNSALIDDLVCSSKALNTKEYHNLNTTEQLRVHLQIHILTLEAIFQAIKVLSQEPGNGPKFKASLKLKLEKSTFATDSLRYLNLIYVKGFKVINLNNFKRSSHYIENMPSHGDELRSALGFFNFLLSFCKSLRYHMKNLESFAIKYPAKKLIEWENHQELKNEYLTLCKVVKASNSLHTLPSDLNQIAKIIYNSDACSSSLAYLVGFTLKPSDSQQKGNQYIKPLKYYSVKLPTYCLNLSILLKETVAAVLCLSQELPTLKLLPINCKKILIMDSKPLFDILSKLLRTGMLDQFFTAHASIPLWLTRLHQLTSTYNIQILLMPTKLSPPADFLTRKQHSPCQTTTKKVNCSLCEGCHLHCIKSTSHTKCPYSIQESKDQPPSLLPFDSVENKKVKIENKTIEFQNNECEVDWSEYTPANLDKILEGTSHQPNIQDLSEADFHNLLQEEVDFGKLTINGRKVQQDLTRALAAMQTKEQLTNNHATTLGTTNPKPTMPPNIFLHTEYFPRKTHSYNFPTNTSVIHFVTQKKCWTKPKTYVAKLLADTAISRIEFHTGQIERVRINNTDFIVICVSVSTPVDPCLEIETLIPNLHQCLSKTHSKHIYYDFNSISLLYQINQWTLVQALTLLTNSGEDTQHCIYVGFPTLLNKLEKSLKLKFPYIHNRIRKGLIQIEPEFSLDPKISRIDCKKQIETQIECLLPLPKPPPATNRQLGIMIRNKVIPLHTVSNISEIQNVLVKDTPIYETTNNISCSYKTTPITQIPISNNKTTLQQEIYNKTGHTYTAFKIQLNRPLSSNHCASLVQYRHHTQPILSTNISIQNLQKIIQTHPEITSIKLLNKKNKHISAATSTATAPQESNQPEALRQLLGSYTNTLIAQASDTTVQKICNEIRKNKQPIQIQDCLFQLFENVLCGKLLHAPDLQSSNYRPVIAESQLVSEILRTHQKFNCGPPKKVVTNIKQRYFHQYNVTSNISLENLCTTILPCYKCSIGTASHVNASRYLETQTIGLQSIGIKSCGFVVMDVMYLANHNSRTFKNNYVSIILCQSCKFLSLKPISRITSDILATHLLEYCQLSGRINTCIISDAASTQVAGQMKNILHDFQIIHIRANQNLLSKQQYINNNPTPQTQRPDNNTNDKSENPKITTSSTPLDHLSDKHKAMLTQDIQQSIPPLYNPVLTHNPVSYKATQLESETSMGSLDNVCKRLQIFLKRFMLDIPQGSNFKDHIETLINSFVFQNNFKLKAAFTQRIPAELHLGLIRTSNILTLMGNIQNLKAPESNAIKNMHQLLHYADNFRQAEANAHKFSENQKARQLKEHGQLLSQDDLIAKLRPLSVLYVRSELGTVPKMHCYAQHHGPHLVLSLNPRSSSANLYGLISGEVQKKSYRQIKLVFSNDIFNLPLFGHLGDDIQFKMIENLAYLKKSETADSVLDNTTKILINIHKLFVFLSPILPTLEDVPKVLTLDITEGEHDQDNDNNSDDESDDDHPDKDDHTEITPHVHFPPADSDETKPPAPNVRPNRTPVIFQTPHNETNKNPNQDEYSTPEIQLSREKLAKTPPGRTSKYNLRQSPQPKRRFPTLDS